jgi:hypothetical protein
MKNTVFNPLDQVDTKQASHASAEQAESTSAFYIKDAGICPKCKQPMGMSRIANQDQVHYCAQDRVTLPLPDRA